MAEPKQISNQRTRYFEIRKVLSNSSAQEAKMVVEMIGILVEDSRTRLVKAADDDMLRAQGEARAFEKLYRDLTTPAPNQETT
jgi:hypothetical protein